MRKQFFNDPVKQAHFEQILKNPQQYALFYEFYVYDDVTERWIYIPRNKILQNSVSFTQQCSDTTQLTIGGVYIGTASLTVKSDIEEPTNGLIGCEVKMFTYYYDPTVGLESQPTGYPLKINTQSYIVQDSTETENGKQIQLVDFMSLFDVNLPISYAPSGSLYLIVSRICEKCGIPFAMTQQQVEALPNGNEVYGYYPESDCVTYRDALHYIAQAVCGFCYYSQWEGGLVIRSYAEEADYDVLAETERIQGAKLSSYTTEIVAATFTNADGSITTIGSEHSGGQTYDIGFNPFMIYGLSTTITRMRTTVFDVLFGMRFKPFSASVIVPPIYDLGDKLLFTGGHMISNNLYSCIQMITWSNNTLNLQGFGQKAKVTSKSDSSSVRQATKASELVIKKSSNYDPIHIGSNETIATQIDFSTLRTGCEVEMWEEFLCDVSVTSSPMTVTAYYYLDGTLLDRRPIETFTDSGQHILDLHYSETVQDSGMHRWIVKLACSGGTIDFDSDDCLAVLKGQGLEKEGAWSGLIVCNDVITTLEMQNILQTLTDTGRVLLENFVPNVFSQQVHDWSMAIVQQNLNENRRVVLKLGDHILRCGRGDRCGLGRTFGGLT